MRRAHGTPCATPPFHTSSIRSISVLGSSAPKTALPATSTSAPVSKSRRALCAEMPPSTSISVDKPASSIVRPQLCDLTQCAVHELLSAEARFDAHHEHQVERRQQVAQHFDRGGRLDRDAGPRPCGVDFVDAAVCGVGGFVVKRHDVGAHFGEALDVAFGFDDHQVYVERFVVACRMNFRTGNPNEMLGTKTPSITSICTHWAALLSIIRVSRSRWPKSAESMEGAIMRCIVELLERRPCRAVCANDCGMLPVFAGVLFLQRYE